MMSQQAPLSSTDCPGAASVFRYFPDLTPHQRWQFAELDGLYRWWNGQINVISRREIDLLYPRHVLHSLAIAKVCPFSSGARVVDVGCGGGFPGIPLAILFPQVGFTLIDSTGKKIKVVNEVAKGIGLQNITALHGRAEELKGRFDFVVGRAVTEMRTFVRWTWDKLEPGSGAGELDNGILCLKGGNLDTELAAAGKPYALYDIGTLFDEEFFKSKKVVYIPR